MRLPRFVDASLYSLSAALLIAALAEMAGVRGPASFENRFLDALLRACAAELVPPFALDRSLRRGTGFERSERRRPAALRRAPGSSRAPAAGAQGDGGLGRATIAPGTPGRVCHRP